MSRAICSGPVQIFHKAPSLTTLALGSQTPPGPRAEPALGGAQNAAEGGAKPVGVAGWTYWSAGRIILETGHNRGVTKGFDGRRAS